MLRLENYYYDLPKEFITKSPATPRGSAKLFVYNTKLDNPDLYISQPQQLYFQALVLDHEQALLWHKRAKLDILLIWRCAAHDLSTRL